MTLSDFGGAWTLARDTDGPRERLMGVMPAKLVPAKARSWHLRQGLIEQCLKALEDWMIRTEARQEQIVTEASNAAIVMASGVIADAVTRMTRLEGRADHLERQRLAAA